MVEIKKALIFGSNGQDGFYLNKILSHNQIECIGISRKGSGIVGDVGDKGFVENIIKKYEPYYIFHFAANSTAQHIALYENHRTISTGTLNILESARLHCPTARIFIAGSALQFLNEGQPIDEQTAFDPSSAYSLARIQSAYAARYFRKIFSMKVYVGYFFNHDSPLRTEKHVNQLIVMAAKRIAEGSQRKLILGNMEVRKEFNFAGDMVAAVWKLINQEEQFEAILGCGIAHSIKEWVIYCFGKLNLTWQDFVEPDPKYIPEYDILVSNPRLIMNMGWKPEMNFYQLADMMLN